MKLISINNHLCTQNQLLLPIINQTNITKPQDNTGYLLQLQHKQMKSPISQKFDSDHIRQGLISIRNTQLELLNELKHQTQMLKHYSPPSTASQFSSKTSQVKKTDRFPSFNVDKNTSIEQADKKAGSQLSLWNQKQLQDEIAYLRNENKLANSNYQKLKRSMQTDKDRMCQLQANIDFVTKLYYDILLQFLQDKDISQIQQFINNQMGRIPAKSTQLKSFIGDVVMLLNEIQNKRDELLKTKVKNASQKDIANQLIDLKSQISILISQSNQIPNSANQLQLSKIRGELESKNDKIKQLQEKLSKMQNQNKQIARFWDKELNERKRAMLELQNLRKEAGKWEQKQKKIIFYAKDMQVKASKLENMLKDKQKSEAILKQNCGKLNETLSLVRESNQSLRLQVKSLEQDKQKRYIALSQQKQYLQRQYRMYCLKQQKMLQNKEIEIQSLRNHIVQIKKNQQSIKEYDRKSKENDLMQQDLHWKKVNILRTNSTIDHLWQVKEVEYENINQLLRKIKK